MKKMPCLGFLSMCLDSYISVRFALFRPTLQAKLRQKETKHVSGKQRNGKTLFRSNPTYAVKYLVNQLRMLGLLLWAYACMPFAWLACLSSFILNIECCCEQGRGGKGGITLSQVNSPPPIFPPVGKSGKMKTGCWVFFLFVDGELAENLHRIIYIKSDLNSLKKLYDSLETVMQQVISVSLGINLRLHSSTQVAKQARTEYVIDNQWKPCFMHEYLMRGTIHGPGQYVSRLTIRIRPPT